MANTFSDALALHQSGRLAEAEAVYRLLLAGAPSDPRLLAHLGLVRAQCGALEEGRDLLAEAVRRDPSEPAAPFHLGSILMALGRPEEALGAFSAALTLAPANAEFYFAAGNAAFQLGRYDEAAEAYAGADRLQPGRIEVLLNWGSALQELGRLEEALSVCGKALAIAPGHPGALNNRGNALRLLNRPEEALGAFETALKVEPQYDLARFNLATVLEALRRHEQALRECDRVLARAQGHAGAHVLRGKLLLALERFDESLDSFERALQIDPDLEAAFHGRVSALLGLTRWEEALANCDAAIAHDPASGAAHNNRGAALVLLRRYKEAEASLAKALALAPDNSETYLNRAGLHFDLGDLDAAYEDTTQALVLRPELVIARSIRFGLAAHLCHWQERAANGNAMVEFCRKGEKIPPFLLTYAFDDPEMHLEAAKRVAGKAQPALARVSIAPRKTLRIAYLSADFRDHPVTHQALELFETHDRERVETYAIALCPMPRDALGARLRGAFSQVVEVYDRSDQDIARRLADLHIDIAVELGGFTDKARPGVLAWRPAPVSVNYLGYPGTLGMPYIDYILADSCIIPPEDDHFYSEKVVRLPHCFMPFDSRMQVASRLPTRAEEGLPENGFVFCNFNKTDKITPEMFDLWMRILLRAPGSVFWFNVQNETARKNLRSEAAARGVDLARIVFASRTESRAGHLARLQLADLFLDTLPYNAHATTSDFLAAGVPVLTTRGRTFASRVAASLLQSVGAEKLVVPDLVAYEAMALKLVEDRAALACWREHLKTHKRTAADTVRLAKSLEEVYFAMWERRVKGLKPESMTF